MILRRKNLSLMGFYLAKGNQVILSISSLLVFFLQPCEKMVEHNKSNDFILAHFFLFFLYRRKNLKGYITKLIIIKDSVLSCQFAFLVSMQD